MYVHCRLNQVCGFFDDILTFPYWDLWNIVMQVGLFFKFWSTLKKTLSSIEDRILFLTGTIYKH